MIFHRKDMDYLLNHQIFGQIMGGQHDTARPYIIDKV